MKRWDTKVIAFCEDLAMQNFELFRPSFYTTFERYLLAQPFVVLFAVFLCLFMIAATICILPVACGSAVCDGFKYRNTLGDVWKKAFKSL